MTLFDALGSPHAPAQGRPRIASLVPSLTELLCELGLTDQMVARTGYCIHPVDAVRRIPKIGGTKTVNLNKLRKLAPTHVLVNVDENEKPTVDALREFVPHVVVTHPCAPSDNLALFRLLGGIFGRNAQAENLCERFNQSQATLRESAREHRARRVLYLIWKDPWMTIAPSTYIAQTLAQMGWRSLPDKPLSVSSPETGRARYPIITLDEPWLDEVDTVLLSTEPYQFKQANCDELAAQPRFKNKTVRLIDGEMTSWFGSRAIAGNDYLARLLRQMA